MFDSIHTLPSDLRDMGWESTGVVVTPAGNRSELEGPTALSDVTHRCLIKGPEYDPDDDEGWDPPGRAIVSPTLAAGIELYAAKRARAAVLHVLKMICNAQGDTAAALDNARHMLSLGHFDFVPVNRPG